MSEIISGENHGGYLMVEQCVEKVGICRVMMDKKRSLIEDALSSIEMPCKR